MKSVENRLRLVEHPPQEGEQGLGANGGGSGWKDKARDLWSERYGREISEAKVDEIHRNLYGFFSILREWKEEDARKAAEGGQPGEVTSE